MRYHRIRDEQLISVLACVRACDAYDLWKKMFGRFEGDKDVYVYGDYETVADATLSHSLISLRSVDDFLSDGKKTFTTDLRYYDFSINRSVVLGGETGVLSIDERAAINVHEAHLTSFAQIDADDLMDLHEALERTKNLRSRLEHELLVLLRASRRNNLQ